MYTKQDLFQQALAFHKKGELAQAHRLYEDLLKEQPRHVEALHFLGVLAYQSNNPQKAVELIGLAIDINPDQADFYSNRGLALQDLRRLDEALASYDNALALEPEYAEAYCNRGNVLKDLNQLTEALASYARAIVIKPDFAQAYSNQGNVLKDLKRFDEALASYACALALNPGYAEAHANRGVALKGLMRLPEALASLDCALALNPGYAEAYSHRGVVLNDLKRLDEALASYACALALKPDYAEAYSNQGVVLHGLKRVPEALASYACALALKPDYAEAYSNQGNALKELLQVEAALTSYDCAIGLNPELAEAYKNKALLTMLKGDFAAGWRLYEWRWQTPALSEALRIFSQPLWLGEQSLLNKTLLIYPEQGFGDYLQFIRYAVLAQQAGAQVILEVPAPLMAVVATLNGNFTLIEKGQPLPAFDYHCPLLSLPLAFKTTVDNIPAASPYLFADTDRQALWQLRLGNKLTPRIGLVWSGSSAHTNDHNRSMALSQCAELFDDAFEFHSLQQEISTTDAAFMAGNDALKNHQDLLHDFADTAALIEVMDLVITVDTSVAHLAGAMGKPVWILLPYAPDFRWLLGRTDSPWYPTATLIRQAAPSDWKGVIAMVKEQLLSLKPSNLANAQ